VNVTVMVPNVLRAAVDGRLKLSLGLPPSADVGDLLEVLFTLYPKLKLHVASDKSSKVQQLTLCGSEATAKDVRGRWRLHEGQTLYLSAPQSSRLVS